MKDSECKADGSLGLSLEREAALRDFCGRLGLRFKDLSLLDLAFRHRSYSNESRGFQGKNNERLEFLGDSVLGLAAASFLYRDMAQNDEGDLSKILSVVVSEKALAPVALEYGADKLLVLGKGEEMTGGRAKPAILADCMEAVIAACYLDSGYEAAERFVLRFLVPAVRSVQRDKEGKDFKSALQEAFQRAAKDVPRYELVRTEGPDHDRVFYVSVRLGEEIFGPVAGKSKKAAEQAAAKAALESSPLLRDFSSH